MEEINKILTLSLKQDLSELKSVTNKMIPYVNNFKQKSWLFSTNGCFEVLRLNYFQDKNCSYTNHLEYLIDQLYVLFNLIHQFIDNILKNDVIKEVPRNVLVPKNLTFGRIASLLCERLLFLNNYLRKLSGTEMKSSKQNTKTTQLINDIAHKDVETQTKVHTLDKCDSCSLAVDCIQTISSVVGIQKFIDCNIYEITQTGFMNKVTSAIGWAVEDVYKKLEEFDEQNRQLKLDLQEARNNFADSTKLICIQENEIRNLKEQLLIEKDKYEGLFLSKNQLHNDSLKSIEKLTTLEEEIEKLKQLNFDCVKNVNEFTMKNVGLMETIQYVALHLDLIFAKNSTLEKCNVVLTEGKIKLQNDIKKLEVKMSKLFNIIEQMNANISEIDSKTTTIFLALENKSYCYSDLLDRIDMIIKEIKVNKMFNTSSDCQEFKVKGEPLDDMRKQVKLNMETIKQLEEENCGLLKIIEKVKKVKNASSSLHKSELLYSNVFE